MSFIRTAALVVLGVVVLIVGSCAAIGASTVYAVNAVVDNVEEFAESDTARKWEKKSKEERLRRHNERINRESAMDSRRQEYDNYE